MASSMAHVLVPRYRDVVHPSQASYPQLIDRYACCSIVFAIASTGPNLIPEMMLSTRTVRQGSHAMVRRFKVFAIASLGALTVGCAPGDWDGSNATTSSINLNTAPPGAIAAAQPKPECLTLQQRIYALRGEGFVASLEKAAAGQAKSVTVMRDDIAKMIELQKTNDAYQQTCGLAVASSASAASSHLGR